MTSSGHPDRPPAAGVFIVQDLPLRMQLADLLEPFRSTKPARPASNDRVKDREALRAAENRIAALEQDIGQTQDLLAQSTTALAAERLAHGGTTLKLDAATADLATAGKELDRVTSKLDQAQTQVVGRDAALARAHAELTKLRAELNTVPTGKLRPAESATGTTSRGRDRDAFASLARRMEDQAKTKTGDVADTLRVAAGFMRREIDTVYGAGKKAS